MKSNTSRFLEDLLFYGNVTLYKMSYNLKKPSNTVIRFDLNRYGYFKVTKCLKWFTDPFFTTEGINRSAKPLKLLLEKELKDQELYHALACIILSDFTSVYFETDKSNIHYCSNNTFNIITTILLNMINFSETDLEKFISYSDHISLNNKKLIELVSKPKSNIIEGIKIKEMNIADKMNEIDNIIYKMKKNLKENRKGEKSSGI